MPRKAMSWVYNGLLSCHSRWLEHIRSTQPTFWLIHNGIAASKVRLVFSMATALEGSDLWMPNATVTDCLQSLGDTAPNLTIAP